MVALPRWTHRRRAIAAGLSLGLVACLGCESQTADSSSANSSSGFGSMTTSSGATEPTPPTTGDVSSADTSTGAVPPDEAWRGVVSLLRYPGDGEPVAQFEVAGELRGNRMEVFGNSPSAVFEFAIDPADTPAHVLTDDQTSIVLTYAATFPDGVVLTEADAAQSDWRVGPNGYAGHGSLGDASYAFTFFLGSDEPVTHACDRTATDLVCNESTDPRYDYDPERLASMCTMGVFVEGPCNRDNAVGECVYTDSTTVYDAGACPGPGFSDPMELCTYNPLGPTGEYSELNGGCG